jgi:hypothetical protein
MKMHSVSKLITNSSSTVFTFDHNLFTKDQATEFCKQVIDLLLLSDPEEFKFEAVDRIIKEETEVFRVVDCLDEDEGYYIEGLETEDPQDFYFSIGNIGLELQDFTEQYLVLNPIPGIKIWEH